VLYNLSELFLEHGIPEHIRCDNGPEFVATAVRSWLDELLNGELFYTLKEAQILIEQWRREYMRPHSSLGGRPPAPETIAWPDFSLEDYAPPALTQEPALALS
jgi:hypothetical protein